MEFQNRLKGFNIEQLQNYNYQGSEGVIYGCQYKTQDSWQQCILKVIQYGDDEYKQIQKQLNVYERLKEEFKKNENLVSIINVIHFNDLKKVCILMEVCDTSLSDFQLNNTKSKLLFFQQFLKGYKSLYDLKVIHRDIKPENILITFKNQKPIYKLTDFGLSKLCEQFNNVQSQFGTQNYVAPELLVFDDQTTLDHEKLSKCDVYSFGLILYELYFNKLPFEKREKQKEFHELLLKDRLNKLGQIEYQDQWFVNLIMYMIQRNPDERVGFKELYKCYDEKLDILIQELKKLTENFLIQCTLSKKQTKVQKDGLQTTRDSSSKSPLNQKIQSQQYQQQLYQNPQFVQNNIIPLNIKQNIQLSPHRQLNQININQQIQQQFNNQMHQGCQTERGNYQYIRKINFQK